VLTSIKHDNTSHHVDFNQKCLIKCQIKIKIYFFKFISLLILGILVKEVMKIFIVNFLIFFCHLKFANSAIYSQNQTLEEFLVSTAISDICEEFFAKKSIKFDLIIYGERTRHLDDVTNGVLRLIEHNFSSTVQYVKDVDD